MTNDSDPQGRAEPASVAALAIQVIQLRRELEALTANSTISPAPSAATAGPSPTSPGSKPRSSRSSPLSTPKTKHHQPSRFWLTMPEEERQAKFAELYDWVETVLRHQYPVYLADHLKPCWPNHPEARWELTWLYQLWTLTYLTTRPTPKDAGDWQDRWTPGVIHRLAQVMENCRGTCQLAVRHLIGHADDSLPEVDRNVEYRGQS